MGLAMFDAVSGGSFAWKPLAGASEALDGSLLVRAHTHGPGDHFVTLAVSRESARHGYLARTRFRPTPESGRDLPEVTLDATLTLVRFQLPTGSLRAGPLRIARLEDPHWLSMEHGTTGLIVTPNEPANVLLGAGTYELRDPITPEHCQRLVVPGPNPVMINSSLTVVQDDRP